MALFTKAEALAMYERESVGDVRPLALAYLELLNNTDGALVAKVEQDAVQRELDELRIVVANRAEDTQHDALVDKVAALEAELEALKPKPAKKAAAKGKAKS